MEMTVVIWELTRSAKFHWTARFQRDQWRGETVCFFVCELAVCKGVWKIDTALNEKEFYSNPSPEVSRSMIPHAQQMQRAGGVFVDAHIKDWRRISCLCFIFLSSADQLLPLYLWSEALLPYIENTRLHSEHAFTWALAWRTLPAVPPVPSHNTGIRIN